MHWLPGKDLPALELTGFDHYSPDSGSNRIFKRQQSSPHAIPGKMVRLSVAIGGDAAWRLGGRRHSQCGPGHA
jgi:hypothetical protein